MDAVEKNVLRDGDPDPDVAPSTERRSLNEVQSEEAQRWRLGLKGDYDFTCSALPHGLEQGGDLLDFALCATV